MVLAKFTSIFSPSAPFGDDRHAVQVTLGYFAMLVAMTYQVELFICIIFGTRRLSTERQNSQL